MCALGKGQFSLKGISSKMCFQTEERDGPLQGRNWEVTLGQEYHALDCSPKRGLISTPGSGFISVIGTASSISPQISPFFFFFLVPIPSFQLLLQLWDLCQPTTSNGLCAHLVSLKEKEEEIPAFFYTVVPFSHQPRHPIQQKSSRDLGEGWNQHHHTHPSTYSPHTHKFNQSGEVRG